MKKLLILLVLALLVFAGYMAYQHYSMPSNQDFDTTKITEDEKQEISESVTQIAEPISISKSRESLSSFLSN